MFIIYNDAATKKGGRIKMEDADAVSYYMTHYCNMLKLDWIAKRSETPFADKYQARKELLIAERKMKFWERHANFDVVMVRRACEAAKRAIAQQRRAA